MKKIPIPCNLFHYANQKIFLHKVFLITWKNTYKKLLIIYILQSNFTLIVIIIKWELLKKTGEHFTKKGKPHNICIKCVHCQKLNINNKHTILIFVTLTEYIAIQNSWAGIVTWRKCQYGQRMYHSTKYLQTSPNIQMCPLRCILYLHVTAKKRQNVSPVPCWTRQWGTM